MPPSNLRGLPRHVAQPSRRPKTRFSPLKNGLCRWRLPLPMPRPKNCPAEVVPLVLDGVPSLPPAVIYAAGILEPPPVVLLTIRGRDRAPIALLEVPGMGPFMFAATVSARGLGVPLLMNRPVMPDAWMSAPDPAFLPIQSGGGNAARMV